ncbi:hypothetical protein J6590_060995 [Homalodisca vitripennis]|nr:hypothetical protein J6590_060995 [Homalodisca vitripennis]
MDHRKLGHYVFPSPGYLVSQALRSDNLDQLYFGQLPNYVDLRKLGHYVFPSPGYLVSQGRRSDNLDHIYLGQFPNYVDHRKLDHYVFPEYPRHPVSQASRNDNLHLSNLGQLPNSWITLAIQHSFHFREQRQPALHFCQAARRVARPGSKNKGPSLFSTERYLGGAIQYNYNVV